MPSNNNDDGQKRCSCKKTNCLKLYCNCFAAGLYCDEACSCQECLNRPDYEDTVEEARQPIQFRNPFAFSSKIHHCLVQSPTSYNEDGDQLKLTARKHRKGCNCKKSMCVKKYCECYQANVGCSGECRCEGCKNVFGKRGGNTVYNEAIHETAKKELQPVGSPFPLLEFHNPHKLTPRTPVQHLSHENNTSTGRYISSSGSANSDDQMFGASVGNYDMVTLDQQLYPNDGESMNQFTPPYTTQFNARHLVSVTNLPQMIDCPNTSRVSDNYSPVIRWPGSVMTPESLFVGPNVYD